MHKHHNDRTVPRMSARRLIICRQPPFTGNCFPIYIHPLIVKTEVKYLVYAKDYADRGRTFMATPIKFWKGSRNDCSHLVRVTQWNHVVDRHVHSLASLCHRVVNRHYMPPILAQHNAGGP